MQQHVGRARRLGGGEGTDRGVVAEDRLNDVALEPLREVVVGRHRQEVDNAVELTADIPVAPQELGALLHVAPVALGRIDRRLEQQLADVLERLLQVGVELGIDLGVLLGEAGELLLRLLHVVREDDAVPVVERREQVVRRQHLEAELPELQVRDDARVQDTHHVGEDRGAEAGRDLLGHGRPADDVAALEDEDLQPGLGEVAAAHQPVVTGPENDRVVTAAGQGRCSRFHVREIVMPDRARGRNQRPPVTRMARKSLTLVSVGPVTTWSPSASKKPWPSLSARLAFGLMPLATARASVSGVTIAPATSSAPSIPSVSPAIAHTPGTPFSATARASRNSTLRPPRPLPRTVTVVSPPESRTQGGGRGWPCWTTESAIPAMSLPTSAASPSSASPSSSGATLFRRATSAAASSDICGVAIMTVSAPASRGSPGFGVSSAGRSGRGGAGGGGGGGASPR